MPQYIITTDSLEERNKCITITVVKIKKIPSYTDITNYGYREVNQSVPRTLLKLYVLYMYTVQKHV